MSNETVAEAHLTYLDTSSLAKWYLNEAASDAVESFLESAGPVHICNITKVELRCLLARRRRTGEISAELESKVFATFEQDVADGHLIVHDVSRQHFEDAVRLISTLTEHNLRTLDALHLAAANGEGLTRLATSDRLMAQAGEAVGLEVKLFT